MLFSIITITRNNLAGLQATQDSLKAQTCRDFQWIVIDGDSQDGTKKHLHELSAICISEPDDGIYDAMNKGIDNAAGDYLLFLNAGDCLASFDTLERVKNAMITPPDFIYGDSLEDGNHKPSRSHTKILNGMFTHHQAMFYNRNMLGNLRYDKKYRIAADYKFTLAFLRRTQSILYCPFPVCIFEPGGVSQQLVTLGRKEQFLARRELEACNIAVNAATYGGQAAAMTVRRAYPRLYWFLRNLR
jgi:putative colanic acid biosynthesis glycosyltransferase